LQKSPAAFDLRLWRRNVSDSAQHGNFSHLRDGLLQKYSTLAGNEFRSTKKVHLVFFEFENLKEIYVDYRKLSLLKEKSP